MAKVFGSFSRLVSLLFRKDGQDITIRPNQATTYTAARDVQLPPGDASHVVVSEGATQTLSNKTLSSPVINTPTGITKSDVGLGNVDNTSDATKNSAAVALTNKTIDADLNTITNIENADIKVGAAIDAAKIHDGSVDNTEFGYLNGVTSSIQTQLTNNATAISDHLTDTVDAHDASAISSVPAGNLAATDVQAALNELQTDVDTRATSSALTTHTGASSGVHGVTGSVVGTTDTQTLTNKTLTSPELDTPLIDDYFDINEEAAPGTPPAGKVRVYAKSDAKLYKKDDSGVEQEIGAGGGSGGINYIDNPLFDDGTVTGWAAYADAAAATPVDGTGGSPNVTFTAQSGSLIRGTFSGRLTKDAANRQGQGASYAFTIDAADTGRPLSIAFDFLAGGSYVAGDVDVFIYDVTNATLITPSNIDVAAGKGTFKAFFVASTSTSYRLILHVATTNASAWTLDTDNFQVGPQVQLSGAAVTDWQAYTPTVSNLGTGSGTVTGFWRRVGDSAEITINFLKDGSGGSGVNPVYFSMPSGLIADPLKYNQSGVSNSLGVSQTYSVEASLQYSTTGVGAPSTTQLAIYNVGGVDYYQGADFRANSQTSISARIPIANWSSNTTMAERAVEEYAWNSSSSTTATDTTSFANGASGALIRFITASLIRRVRFQTPILATDNIFVEVSPDQQRWFPISNGYTDNASFSVCNFQQQNTTLYGLGYPKVINSTDVDVNFGQYSDANGATYAAAGRAWSAGGGGLYWRVRKVSGGAVVGYPVASTNIVSDGQGVAIPTGYLGEQQISTQSTLTNAAATGTYLALCSVPLTPGVWEVSALAVQNKSGATFNDESEALISTVSGGVGSAAVGTSWTFIREPAVSASGGSIPPIRVLVTANTTYYLNVRSNYSAGTPQWRGQLRAVRVR